MPKQNRYHPYARPTSTNPANLPLPPLDSPRYPSTPAAHHAYPSLPSITEQIPNPQPSLASHCASHISQPIETYQPINLDYIRAVTSDGLPLIARSILRSDDGTFFVKMDVVGFPSTVSSTPENPGMCSQQESAYQKFLQGLGYGAGQYLEQNMLGGPVGYPTPLGSSDAGSERRRSFKRDELSLISRDMDEEDALGDVDEEWKKQEQSRVKQSERMEGRRRGGR